MEPQVQQKRQYELTFSIPGLVDHHLRVVAADPEDAKRQGYAKQGVHGIITEVKEIE